MFYHKQLYTSIQNNFMKQNPKESEEFKVQQNQHNSLLLDEAVL